MVIEPEIIGDAVLYRADCREILPVLGAGSIDAVITDLPYSEQTHQGARTAARHHIEYWRKDPDVLINFPAFTQEETQSVLALMSPLVRSWVIVFTDWHFIYALEEHPPVGLRFVRFGIYVKPNSAPQFTGDRPGTGWEAIAILHREGGRMKWNGGGHHAVWIYNKPHQDSYEGNHPTVKSLSLMKDIVQKFTNRGATVLDPFAGSGTTGVACVQLGRKFVGIEISEVYFNIALKRITAAYQQPRLPLAETSEHGVPQPSLY